MSSGEPVAAHAEGLVPATTDPPVAAIQSAPDTGTDPRRIPLPPLATPSAAVPEGLLRRIGRIDGFLVFVLLVFAFLAASFRASNSDLFLHLATGRLVAQGEYTFGGDPFTFTASGSWVNHSWLYGLVGYLVYSIPQWGPVILVVLKALGTVVAAGFMLRTASQPGKRTWVPVLCTILAVLALSARVQLQPTIVSMLLLAVLVYLLTRPATTRAVWFAPVVCLFWVNLDAWFLLGPVTILLFLVGQVIQQATGTMPGAEDAEAKMPGVGLLAGVLAGSLLACLINPYHVNAFTHLPLGLVQTRSLSVLASEPTFRGYFLSPFDPIYFSPSLGLSAAGLAFYALLVVGLISFLLVAAWNLDGLRWWRVLVWLAFAALAAWNFRAILFFAVVGGSIASLNFLDVAPRLLGAEPLLDRNTRSWLLPCRALSVLAGIALVICSIPGWLQAQPHHRRQVAWGIDIDAGLKQAALTVASWRETGRLAEGQRWYNTSPEVVNYFAWFCPGEKGFIDQRLELFTGLGEDFVAVRKALAGDLPVSDDKDGPPPPSWRRVFGKREIHLLVFHTHDLTRASSSLNRLYSNPQEFVPCFAEGNTAIFLWRDPRLDARPLPDSGIAIDFSRVAFGPGAVPAPDRPGRATGEGPWWLRLILPEGPTPAETLTALQHWTRFDALGLRYQQDHNNQWLAAMASGLAGLGTAPGGPLPGGLLLPLRMNLTYAVLVGEQIGAPTTIDMAAMKRVELYNRQQDSGPPDSLYIALRACRRSMVTNPDDPLTQFLLAQAYTRLAYRTRERARISYAGGNRDQVFFPHPQLIRQSQVAAALRNVFKVNPRPERAQAGHWLLAQVFIEPQYLELHFHHLREYLRLSKQLKSMPGVPSNHLADALKNLDDRVKEQDKQLKNLRDRYEVDSANKPVLQKVQIALRNGLAETALNLLLSAKPEDMRDPRSPQQNPGLMLLIDLLLGVGRVDEALEVLVPDAKNAKEFDKRTFGTHPLGVSAYDWFRVQAAAAIGDYVTADTHLADSIEALRRNRTYSELLVQLDVMPSSFAEQESDPLVVSSLLLGNVLLREATQASGMPWQILRHLPNRIHPPHHFKQPGPIVNLAQGAQALLRISEQEADLWTLRAWLALEAGWIDRADQYASRSLDLADLGPARQGGRLIASFRSRPLAVLVRELAERKPAAK